MKGRSGRPDVVSNILNVSDFIIERPEHIFFKRLGIESTKFARGNISRRKESKRETEVRTQQIYI